MKCVHMKMIVLMGIKEEGRLYRNDDKLRRVREMFSWLIVRTAVKIPFCLTKQILDRQVPDVGITIFFTLL